MRYLVVTFMLWYSFIQIHDYLWSRSWLTYLSEENNKGNYYYLKFLFFQDKEIEDISKAVNSLMAISLAVAYIGNFYIMFNIKERVCQAKHLQFVSGINVFIFWLVSFIADLLTYLIPAVAVVISFSIIKPSGLATFEHLSKYNT